MILPAPRILSAFTLVALIALASPLWGESTPAATDPVVELPKMVVTDSRELPPPEAWRYAEIPGFEILSNASDQSTRRLLKDFDLFRQALGLIWPVPNRSSVPMALILCGKGGKFDAFVPDGKSSAERALASLFLKGREQTAIVIDLESTSLAILNPDAAFDTAATGTDSSLVAVDHDKQLYREYVHFLLSKSEPRLPAWFEEGMAQIVMAMKVDKKSIVFGRIESANTVSAEAALVAATNAGAADAESEAPALAGAPAEDRDFNAALLTRSLVPLDAFFAVAHDAPEAINPLGDNVWAKQCYAFVHMCLYGRGKRYQKPFATLLVRASKEPVTEALFKECFGMDYKKMRSELRNYIEFTDYEHQEFVIKGGGLTEAPPLNLRDATPGEVGRIKGEALALGGHPDRARTELVAPYIRGERDPRLLASLGLFDHTAGDDVRARKFLEAATTAKVARPRAYLELARFRFADATAKPGAGTQFSAEQVNGVIAPLLTARLQLPALPEVYELMADAWTSSAVPPRSDDVVLLIEGARLFPGRLKLVYEVAGLSLQAGMLDVAHTMADHGLKFSPDAKSRAMFEKLKASLPPAKPATAAAPKR